MAYLGFFTISTVVSPCSVFRDYACRILRVNPPGNALGRFRCELMPF